MINKNSKLSSLQRAQIYNKTQKIMEKLVRDEDYLDNVVFRADLFDAAKTMQEILDKYEEQK